MLDSAQKTLIDIASVSQRVVNALVKYDGRKTVESFRLDKIVVGSGAALATLNKSLSLRERMVDDRLADWLESEEPQICLDTLNQMDVMLSTHPNHGVNNLFQSSRVRPTKNQGSEAIRLFQKRKDCFHFLLTTDIWNCESGAGWQPQAVSHVNVSRIGVALDKRSIAQITQRVQWVEISRMDAIGQGKLDSVLEWLNAWKCVDTHERTTLLRQPDTCTWLPDTRAYQTWRNAENSFLWLNGKAGAGKSVLAASVIEGLEGALEDGEVLVFFYCDFRSERSTSASEVMRSLLSQLLQKLYRNVYDAGDLVDELIKRKDGGASTIENTTRLARYISRMANKSTRQPFVIIDALDECKDIEELLDAVMELNKGGVRLFVTSRPLQVIKEGFSGLPSISMDMMTYEVSTDIKLHITRELDSHRRLRIMDPGLKAEIKTALCEKADGMFRWVQCQLVTLKQCVTTVRIREALNNLPGDLNTTYERILLGINKNEEGDVVRRTLEWLVTTIEPMQLSQIMESLSIDLKRRVLDYESRPVHGPALLDALGSLVIYDELTDVVALSHFSVKEYLVGEFTRTKHPAYHIDERAACTQLALLCMCYIAAYLKYHEQSSQNEGSLRGLYGTTRYEDLDVIPSRATEGQTPSLPKSNPHPFLEYIQLHGFHHLFYGCRESKVILRAIETLHSDVYKYPSGWERLCERTISQRSWPPLRHDFVLYMLIAFAPEPLLRLYIGRSKTLKLKDGTNPLIYAAYFHRVEHAKTLLSSGVSLSRTGWCVDPDLRQVLPLEAAIDRQNLPVLDLLLAEWSPVPCQLFESVLEKQYSRLPASFVARLLQTDQFVEWAADIREERLLLALYPSRYSGMPPFHASHQDLAVIQRRLAQLGCDTSSPRVNEMFLRHAASTGHVSSVKYMLASGTPVPPDIILDASRSRSSNPTVIRLFLSRSCDIDIISPDGDTPLHLVMKSGSPEVNCLESIQVLIDAGCNPSARNLVGETPIHLAASLGYISVMKYLHSMHVPLPSDILHLHFMPREFTSVGFRIPALSTVLFLLRLGAVTHHLSANGNTSLHVLLGNEAIVSEDCLECTKILIDAGCNPCMPNAVGETAFDVAVINRRLPVAEYLFSLNLVPSPRALLSVCCSVFSDATSMIKLLISKGTDIRVTNFNGDTALHLSMSAYQEEASLQRTKLLVNAGCDTRARNAAGKTPLHVAARTCEILFMEYLISVGTPIPSDVMRAVLEQEEYNLRSCYPAIRFLLGKGGDAHVITENGDSLLHLAAMLYSEHDALEVVKLLVRAGCNPRVLNSAHETPFHIAARHGHISVVDYFLSLDVPLPPDILLALPRENWQSDKANMICFLIDKGADPSAATSDGDTALHLLLSRNTCDEDGGLASAKILFSAGCDPNAQNLDGKTVLHVAATYGFASVLEYLLSQDIPLPNDIVLASTRTLRFLLERGVDVRSVATNYGDAVALLQCLYSTDDEDYLDRAKFLVGLGWDLSLKNSEGTTAVHAMARQGDLPTLKYLLSQRIPLPADILLAAVPNDTYPCMSYSVLVVQFLILEGANVGITSPDGDTPLHLALKSEVIHPSEYPFLRDRNDLCRLIEILLEHGSDPYAKNADGKTPFDLAEAKGRFFKDNFLRLVRNTRVRCADS